MPSVGERSSPLRLHIGSLDGLRGLCALWVVLGHALSMTGPNPVFLRPLEHPLLGVDIFIVLSGFLMLSHYRERQNVEPWRAPVTWLRFWIRRAFRIAPLYYAALLLVLVFRPQILAAWDQSRADLDYIVLSPQTVIQHLTFVFGMLPGTYWSRPLPDWSLSLEMQFYAVFPFIALLWARAGALLTTACLVVGCLILTQLQSGYFSAFELPSALPAKLHVFLAGMLLAAWVTQPGKRSALFPVLAVLSSFLPLPGAGGAPSMISRAVLIAAVALLIHTELGTGIAPLRLAVRVLSGRVLRFMGVTSYGVYLVHFPLLLILNALITTFRPDATGLERLGLLSLTLLPATYALAWIGHTLVEQPGIQMGRMVLSQAKAIRFRMQRLSRASGS
jgi:peptidoglycan/LPS O-acetylase OafA/YrhL